MKLRSCLPVFLFELTLGFPSSQFFEKDANGYVVLKMTRTLPPKYNYFIDDYLEETDSDGISTINLANLSPVYITKLEFGSNNQEIILEVDTGSSDIWVTSSSYNCDSDNSACPLYGTFDSTASKSYQTNKTSFSISYNGGDSYTGIYASDSISFSGITIKDANFAVVDNGKIGIMGISTPYGESLLTNTGEGYDNFLIQLEDEGFINKLTTSIYLNGFNTAQSNILFGAVDHCKYQGDLTLLPLLNPYGDPIPDTYVTVSSLKIGTYSEGTEIEIGSGHAPAQFDTGNPITYLPRKVIDSIVSNLPFVYDDQLGEYLIDCNLTPYYYFTFNFQGLDITVSLNQYVASITDLDGNLLDSCYLAIGSSNDSLWSLGNNFMASAYIVTDWDNLVVGIAPALLDSTCEDIDSSGDSIPSGVSAASYSDTWTTDAPFTMIYQSTTTPTAKITFADISPKNYSSFSSFSTSFFQASETSLNLSLSVTVSPASSSGVSTRSYSSLNSSLPISTLPSSSPNVFTRSYSYFSSSSFQTSETSLNSESLSSPSHFYESSQPSKLSKTGFYSHSHLYTTSKINANSNIHMKTNYIGYTNCSTSRITLLTSSKTSLNSLTGGSASSIIQRTGSNTKTMSSDTPYGVVWSTKSIISSSSVSAILLNSETTNSSLERIKEAPTQTNLITDYPKYSNLMSEAIETTNMYHKATQEENVSDINNECESTCKSTINITHSSLLTDSLQFNIDSYSINHLKKSLVSSFELNNITENFPNSFKSPTTRISSFLSSFSESITPTYSLSSISSFENSASIETNFSFLTLLFVALSIIVL